MSDPVRIVLGMQVVVDVEAGKDVPAPLVVADVLRAVRAGGVQATSAAGLSDATRAVVSARESLVEVATWTRGLSARLSDAVAQAVGARTDDRTVHWIVREAVDEALGRVLGALHQRIPEPPSEEES